MGWVAWSGDDYGIKGKWCHGDRTALSHTSSVGKPFLAWHWAAEKELEQLTGSPTMSARSGQLCGENGPQHQAAFSAMRPALLWWWRGRLGPHPRPVRASLSSAAMEATYSA